MGGRCRRTQAVGVCQAAAPRRPDRASSPGCGSTCAISARPSRSRSASWARSRRPASSSRPAPRRPRAAPQYGRRSATSGSATVAAGEPVEGVALPGWVAAAAAGRSGRARRRGRRPARPARHRYGVGRRGGRASGLRRDTVRDSRRSPSSSVGARLAARRAAPGRPDRPAAGPRRRPCRRRTALLRHRPGRP